MIPSKEFSQSVCVGGVCAHVCVCACVYMDF